ncbi:xanthine dehydrogenase family protein molybdopterin-binding subunit [Pseudonocardia acidicola]|uniref:Xanthine dehydrogenase family protein n=1 Tax=Pseudonocardia acidicola TaxID=2724939 RepID=A0ABX1SAU3_9PSEU|nr:xanthine dehydrogenase family protein molybdopterin-binding subunit [Pseudonocardia acidicola]NMH97486.1 xanthine dehydrogenase family protein [Pseudonocardia acidicola]
MTEIVAPQVDTTPSPVPAAPPIEQIRRKDGDLVLTGRGGYLDDVVLPGTLHAAVLRSPHPHARIRGIDTSAADDRPGVRLVLTGQEARDAAGIIPHFFDPALVGGRTADFRCLAVDTVGYEGEPVAAVVAETVHDAQAALDAVVVDYEPLPFVLDADEALAPEAPTLFEGWDDNVLIRLPFAEGDAAAVLASAPHVLDGEIHIARYQTAPMETRGYLASWGPDGRLTFYASTQNPHPLRSHLAEILDVPESSVRVVATRLGGGFGHKFHGYPEESLVCLLARMVGAPVKWVESREECMLVGAREFVHRFTVAFDDDGRILALRDRILANVGALGASGGWGMAFVAGMAFPGPYRITDYDVESVAVVTHKPPWNGARGYGKESAALAIERIVDLVAAELSLDPAGVRRRNFIPPEEFPYWTAVKHLDSGRYAATLDHALELAGYDDLRREQARDRATGRLVGVGIGFELTPEGGDFSGALLRGFDTSTVRMDPSGRATVLTGVTSPGTGNETAIAQLVAAELGMSPGDVTVIQGDTDLCPYGYGNFSSRSLTVGGAAAVLAARDVRNTLARAAGVLLETAPEKIVFAGGRVAAPERSMSIRDLAGAVFRRTVAVAGLDDAQLESTRTYTPANVHNLPDEQGRWSPYPSFPYSAHIAVVEIDPGTGVVTLRGYSGVHDCGTIINPVLVESQFLGAIAMGIGGALWEELPYGPDGRLRARTFKQYLMPRAPDLPWIRTGHEVTPSPFALLGMKGSGESGTAGAVASVANAVNDALSPLGVSVHRMPLSAPRILAAIRKAGRR